MCQPSPAPSPAQSAERTPTHEAEVVIVGGGPAGLSCALQLARARRSVIVLDDDSPRNERAAHMHGFLTRDGLPPAELRALGRAEVEGYGVTVLRCRATDAAILGDSRGLPPQIKDPRFEVCADDGTVVHARRLVVATGSRDTLPDVPGLAERWGIDVLHCPYCHGYELADQPIVVLATSDEAWHQALLLHQWSADITLVTHQCGELADEPTKTLCAAGVKVRCTEVTGLRVQDDRLVAVQTADGELPAAAVFLATTLTGRTEWLDALEMPVVEKAFMGKFVETDLCGRTSLAGVYAAGNVMDLGNEVIEAAAQGALAALALNGELVATDAAIARHSQGLEPMPDDDAATTAE